jgi:GH25 family lysozyme M1 (1,4-beta-N-acetylmuramidase)
MASPSTVTHPERSPRPLGRLLGRARTPLAVLAAAGLLLVAAGPAVAGAAPVTTTTAGLSSTTTTAPSPSTTTAAPSTSTTSTTATTVAPTSTGTTVDPATDASFVTGPPAGQGVAAAGRGPSDAAGANGAAAFSTPAAGAYLIGPDVSSWQHPSNQAIDWGQVAAGGSSFAFIKATEGPSTPGGRGYTNPWFAGDYASAGSAGLYRAGYHFARPMLPLSTATDQARQLVAAVGTANGALDLAPVLDIEVTGGLGPTDLTNWAVTFSREVERLTGRPPIVYTGSYFWKTYLANTTALSNSPLWWASWTSAATPGTPFGGWSSWSFWQYTDSGSSPGIAGAIDMSRACCGAAGLALAAGHPMRGYMRSSNTTGVATSTVDLGAPTGGTAIACDFNGDGVTTMGVFDQGTWYITDSTDSGNPSMVFGYGQPGDRPVCGDWDGNGTQTPGIVRNGVWYLTNTLGAPTADIVFGYGAPTDTPVVGDWDGRGRDKPGVYRNGVWYLSLVTGRTVGDIVTGYGNPTGDIPVVGDWDGNGVDTLGVLRNGVWYLSNSLASPFADTMFWFGVPGDRPLTGHWRPGLPTTIAVARQL